jgi:hypothetical protein
MWKIFFLLKEAFIKFQALNIEMIQNLEKSFWPLPKQAHSQQKRVAQHILVIINL